MRIIVTNCNINIDNISIGQRSIIWYSVAYNIVHRSAYGFWEQSISQWRWISIRVYYFIVNEFINFVRRNTRLKQKLWFRNLNYYVSPPKTTYLQNWWAFFQNISSQCTTSSHSCNLCVLLDFGLSFSHTWRLVRVVVDWLLYVIRNGNFIGNISRNDDFIFSQIVSKSFSKFAVLNCNLNLLIRKCTTHLDLLKLKNVLLASLRKPEIIGKALIL